MASFFIASMFIDKRLPFTGACVKRVEIIEFRYGDARMTQAVSGQDVYDPKHPWLMGEDEDPRHANWFLEFVNPVGRTAKPVFLRGQLLLAIFRGFFVMFGFMATGASPWVGAFILFFLLFLILILSSISHVRRLNDSGRSPLWVVILFVPMIVASSLAIQQVRTIPQQIEAYKAEQAEFARAKEEAAKAKEAGLEAPATDADASTEEEQKPPQRRAPVTEAGLLGGAVQSGLFIWLILSGVVAAAFSLGFVARGQRVTA